jgi:hypothetical protein
VGHDRVNGRLCGHYSGTSESLNAETYITIHYKKRNVIISAQIILRKPLGKNHYVGYTAFRANPTRVSPRVQRGGLTLSHFTLI